MIAETSTWQAQTQARIAEEATRKAQTQARIAEEATKKALAQASIAESRRLAAISEAERDKRLDHALLLEVEAHDLLACKDHDTASMREARHSLFGALVVRPGLTAFLHSDEGSVSSVAFSPDGKTLAAGYGVGAASAAAAWCSGTRRDASGSRTSPCAVKEGDVRERGLQPRRQDHRRRIRRRRRRRGGAVGRGRDASGWSRRATRRERGRC